MGESRIAAAADTPNLTKLEAAESSEQKGNLPARLKLWILGSVFIPLAAVVAVCYCLSAQVNESSPERRDQMPVVFINGTGSKLMGPTYWRSLEYFANYLKDQKAEYNFESHFADDGSIIGQDDFFQGKTLFGSTDVDLLPAYKQYFLPDNGTEVNVTNFINPGAQQHLGTLMMPTIATAIAIIYNIPEVDKLILHPKVLGDIYCGEITWWNDTAIQTLNPAFKMPKKRINVFARGDVVGTNEVISHLFSEYSPKFNKSIGVSLQPNWPSTFSLALSRMETVFQTLSHPYSIAYTPLEAPIQAMSIGPSPQIAFVVNSDNLPTQPDVDSIQTTVKSANSGTEFEKHNFFTVFDVSGPQSYPITLASFIILQEHYFYYKRGSPEDCARVKAMVYFWHTFFMDPAITESNLRFGGVPLPYYVLENNLRALKLITCNRENIMQSLVSDFERKDYYANRVFEYDWDFSLTIWENHSSFKTAPISSSLYTVFYVVLFLCNAIPFVINIRQTFKTGETQQGIQAERISVSIRNSTLPDKSQIEGDDDDEEDSDEKLARKEGKIPFTSQNMLGILTQLITCFQLLYLCLTKSNVTRKNESIDLISYFGLIPTWYGFYVVINCMVSVWIACMFYTTFFYGVLEKYHPRKLMSLTHFHAFLAEFLPNYAVIFYNPSIEVLAKVVDCRFAPAEHKFLSSSHKLCWVGSHWTSSVISIILVCTFTNYVVRYSKILKHLRKDFDFKDEDWCIYVDSVAKTIILILYFNISNKIFLGISFFMIAGLSLCSIVGKPNSIFWYNYFRGGFLAYTALVYLVLFVFELVVAPTDYNRRGALSENIPFAVLVTTLSIFGLAALVITIKYKSGLSKAQLKAKEAELKKFFAAFGDEIESQLAQEAESMLASHQVNASESNLDQPYKLASKASASNLTGSSGAFSSNQWKQFDIAIKNARKVHLLTREEAKAVRLGIKVEDPIIPVLFSRCGKNLNKFVDYFKMKVYQVLAHSKDQPVSSIRGIYPLPAPVNQGTIGAHRFPQGVDHSSQVASQSGSRPQRTAGMSSSHQTARSRPISLHADNAHFSQMNSRHFDRYGES